MSITKMLFKRQKGVTLTEALGVLVVLALLLGGAYALLTSATTSQQSSQLGADIASLRAATKQLWGAQGSYGSTSLNATLISAGRVPSDLPVSESTISNPFGGTVTVTGATNAFTVAVTNIPTANCVALISNATVSWTSIQVGAATAITTFPVSPATASSATNCGASNANTITFTSN
jgi:type II secretory pathway pseudopilin PulG